MSIKLPRLYARCAAVAALCAITFVAAAQAPAQRTPQAAPRGSQAPPNALQGFSQNRDQPVKIQADKLEVRDKKKVATFTGNVHVTQGDTEMRSPVLVVYYDDAAGKPGSANEAGATGEQQQIRRIEASGGVRVTQKDQNAVGDSGIFDVQSNTMTLTGNVVVTRGKDVLRGQRLVVNLNTGVSRIESAAGGQVESLFGSHDSNPSSGARPPRRN